ncbi:radical SAM protein, partial [Pseudomonas aeruginosa]
LLTDLGRARPGGYQRPRLEDDKALDLLFYHDGSVWMSGIPRRHDPLRLPDLLREPGHQLSFRAPRPRRMDRYR